MWHCSFSHWMSSALTLPFTFCILSSPLLAKHKENSAARHYLQLCKLENRKRLRYRFIGFTVTLKWLEYLFLTFIWMASYNLLCAVWRSSDRAVRPKGQVWEDWAGKTVARRSSWGVQSQHEGTAGERVEGECWLARHFRKRRESFPRVVLLHPCVDIMICNLVYKRNKLLFSQMKSKNE